MNLLQCWFHRLGNWGTERLGPALSQEASRFPSRPPAYTPPTALDFPPSEPRFSPCALEPGAALDSTFRDRGRDSLGRRGGEREDEVRVRGRTVSLIPWASASARTQSPAAASERGGSLGVISRMNSVGTGIRWMLQISGTHQKRGRSTKQRGWTGLRPVCH